MNYEFHPEAEQELYEAALRYESEIRELGRRFGEEVNRVIRLLLEHPELGSRLDDDLRHFVLSTTAAFIGLICMEQTSGGCHASKCSGMGSGVEGAA